MDPFLHLAGSALTGLGMAAAPAPSGARAYGDQVPVGFTGAFSVAGRDAEAGGSAAGVAAPVPFHGVASGGGVDLASLAPWILGGAVLWAILR